MEQVRARVMYTMLAGWVLTLIATVVRGGLPDPVLLTSIGGLYVAVYPPSMPWSRQTPTPPADEGTSQ